MRGGLCFPFFDGEVEIVPPEEAESALLKTKC